MNSRIPCIGGTNSLSTRNPKKEPNIVSPWWPCRSRYTQLIKVRFPHHTITSLRQLGMMSMTPLLCLIRDANEDSTCQSAYQKKKSRIEDLHEKIHAHKSKDATFTSFEKVHTHTHTHTNKTLVSVLTFNILPASPTNMQEIRMISKIIQMFKVFVFVVSYTIPSVKAHCPNISDFINDHLDSELAGCRGAGGGTPACTSLIYRAQSSRL